MALAPCLSSTTACTASPHCAGAADHVLDAVGHTEPAALVQPVGFAGVHPVLNYKTDAVAERVREITQGQGVDRIIELDVAVNGAMGLGLLRTGGERVAYGSSPQPLNLPFPVLLAKNIPLKLFMVYHLGASHAPVGARRSR